MYAVATFLIVAVITLFFVQIVTGALIATGLPAETASFQARSAFSGAGFTTTESENVVNHSVRRRLIATAILVGTLGTPTLVVTVIAGLIAPGPASTVERTLVAVAGVALVVLVLGSRPVRQTLERVGHRYARQRLIPALSGRAEELLVVGDDHIVGSIRLADDPSDTARSLPGLDAALPGIEILGVRRGTRFFAESPIDLTLRTGDELVVFGRRERIVELAAS